ncbi:MAG: cupredoxin domain-containing protein [Elusimicrobia bacterium]|nr:cupredoxin domain-containing protein [Elusimicrobiota bacterium]
MKRLVLACLWLAAAAPLAAGDAPAPAPALELTSVNIEYRGTKVWVPSTFIVRKGQRVRLTLINNAPSGVHGFAIDEFDIKAAVNNEEKDNKKVVEFTPTKTGLIRTYCHLHPAHIGGQILVID